MIYLVSRAAAFSFPAEPFGYKTAVLIKVSTAKLRHYYSLTDEGRIFFSHPQGVEKPEKLSRATPWIRNNPEVWAPVIDVRSPDVERFSIADGRHTFVALEQAGHAFIEIAVPEDRAEDLRKLLSV